SSPQPEDTLTDIWRIRWEPQRFRKHFVIACVATECPPMLGDFEVYRRHHRSRSMKEGAMSENPELTPAVLDELRTALLTRQADLQREIADLRQSEQGTVDQPEDATYSDPSDAGDDSVDLQDREDTSDALGALQAQLDEVEHALAKFATGTYGVCESCGR